MAHITANSCSVTDTHAMQPLIPLRQTYSAVPSPLSSSDDIPSREQKHVFGSQAPLSKQHPRTILRHSFLIRTIIFMLLEIGFIALVCVALRKPIILHLSAAITGVKGAVTVIAILWHALAIYAVKDILLNIFSAEWAKLHDGSHNLSLQELDSVSRLTTGFLDQAKHFASRHATRSFRFAFLSFLLLIVLNGLGPGSIGVNSVPHLDSSSIEIANLTIGAAGASESAYSDIIGAISHASVITRFETVENITTLGYHTTQPNMLIPWPSSDSSFDNTTVTYESDVIRYNFNCSWNKPSNLNNTGGGWVMAAEIDEGSTLHTFPASPGLGDLMDPTLFPLMRINASGTATGSRDIQAIGSDSHSYFIFVGTNSTQPVLRLDDLPTIILPCNTSLNPLFPQGSPVYCQPLSVSILICNPQLEILPATINATASSLNATILPGLPTVKNIPREAANTIFSSSLLEATSGLSYMGILNYISSDSRMAQIFLPNVSWPFKPLSLPEINQNMNKILASSAKAYLNGYPSTVNTSAIVEVQKTALVGSMPFLVATSVIVGLQVVLLGVLVATTKGDQLEAFELENIVKRLKLNYVSSTDA